RCRSLAPRSHATVWRGSRELPGSVSARPAIRILSASGESTRHPFANNSLQNPSPELLRELPLAGLPCQFPDAEAPTAFAPLIRENGLAWEHSRRRPPPAPA